MSTVEERVLEMKFINEQFEKKAAESIKTLGNLEKSLDMGKSTKSLEAIEKNLETLTSKFTFIGRLGLKVFDDISNSAIRAGKNIANTLTTQQINAGFSKYEQKTKAIQTILAATESQGKTLKDVEVVVERLAKYTDETSYSFTEMISSIGKFTANGIDLDAAERAMEGIANEAARSGAGINEANRAMYNFSQALATGKVTLIDWKSIENANMATKEFKEQIIQTAIELGALNEAGKTKKGTLVDFQNFNNTLQEGWFNSEVLIKVLEKYSDTTTEFGKKAFEAAQKALTFKDAIDAIKDAESSKWMVSFGYIFGDLEESIELWTDFCVAITDALDPIHQTRNELLKMWHDMGGRADLIQGISDIFDSLLVVMRMVGDAWGQVFPPITVDTLLGISNAIKDVGQGMKDLFHYDEITTGYETIEKLAKVYGGFTKEIKEGDTGDEIKTLQENLKKLGLYDGKIDGVFGPKTLKALKEFQTSAGTAGESVGSLSSMIAELTSGDKGSKVKELQKQLIDLGYELPKYGADGIYGKETEEAVQKYIKDIGLATDATAEEAETLKDAYGVYGKMTHIALLEAIGGDIKDVKTLTLIKETMEVINPDLANFMQILIGVSSAVHIAFDAISGIVKIFSTFLKVLSPIGKVLYYTLGTFGRFIEGIDKSNTVVDFFENLNNGIETFINPFVENLNKAADSVIKFFGLKPKSFIEKQFDRTFASKLGITSIGQFIDTIKSAVTETEAFKKVSETLKSISDTFSSMFSNISEQVGNFFGEKFGSNLEENGWSIENFANTISSGVEKFLTFIDPFISAFDEFIKTISIDDIVSNVSTWAGGAFDSVVSFFTGIYDSVSQNETFISAKDAVLDFFSSIPDRISEFISAIPGYIENIKTFFTNLYNQVKESEQAKAVWDTLTSFFSGIGESLSNFYNTVMNFVNGLASKGQEGVDAVGEAVTGITDAVGNQAESLSSGISWFVELFGTIGKTVEGAFKSLGPGGIAALLLTFLGVSKILKAIDIFGRLNDGVNYLVQSVKEKRDPKKIQSFGQSFREFATGILIIANSIKMIADVAKMDYGWVGIAVVGVIAVLAVIMTAMSKKMPQISKDKVGASYGRSFLEFAIGIMLIAASMKLLSTLNEEEFKKAGIALAAIVGSFLILIIVMGILNKTSSFKVELKGVWEIAAVVAALSFLAWLLGHSDFGKMLKGLFLVGLVMAELAIFMKIVNATSGNTNVKYGGLVAVAFAVGLLSVIAILLSYIEFGRFIKGLAAIGLVMLEIAIFMKLVNNTNGSTIVQYAGLIALAAAIGILAAIAVTLSMVPPRAMNRALTALGSIMLMFGLLTRFAGFGNVKLSSVIGMIAEMVVLFGAIALLMYFTRDYETDRIVSIINSISLIAIAFAILGGVKIDPGTALMSVAGIVVLLGGLIAIFAALDALRNNFSGFKDLTDKIPTAIGDFFGKMAGAFKAASIKEMAKGLKELNAADITEEGTTNALACADLVREFAGKLPEKGALENVVDFFTGGELGGFSKGLGFFGDGISSLMESIKGVELDKEKVDNAVNAVDSLAKLSQSFGSYTFSEGLGTALADGGPFSTFAKDMPTFAENVIKAYDSLAPLPKEASEVFTRASESAEPIAGLAKDLGNYTAGEGWAMWLSGRSKFYDFCSNMIEFGVDVTLMSWALKAIPSDAKDNVTKAKDVATVISDFMAEVSEKKIEQHATGFLSLFGNKTKADEVFDAMKTIGNSVIELQNTISGKLNDSIVDDVFVAATCFTKVGEALDGLQGEYYVDTGLVRGVLQCFEDSGDYMKSFSDKISGINILQLIGMTNSYKKIFESLSELSTEEVFKGLNADTAATKINTFVSRVKTVLQNRAPDISGQTDNFKQSGSQLSDSIIEGMSSNTDASSAVKGICRKAISALEGFIPEFRETGKNAVKGFANGIENNVELGRAAGRYLGTETKNALDESIRVNSPSKEFYKSGRYSVLGYTNAFYDLGHMAYSASEYMGKESLSGIASTLASVSDMVSEEVDTDPVIRPVVDMSNVTASAKTIGGLMNQSGNLSLSTDEIRKSAASAASSLRNQNGSANTVNNSYSNDNSVTINGNFSVRDQMDVEFLAQEIAGIIRNQSVAAGVKTIG